jgi:2-polyprenyl-6-methoxyphenol hydroxylase-like FAD-dependent oxidoreductase
MEVAIIGAGIGGLTLALALQSAGIASRVFEATTDLRPLGVGINVLPHASRELRLLGLESALTNVSVLTREAAFFNRFGQLIHHEPLGRDAGYADPQYSIHRAALHRVLHDAVVERLGVDRISFGSTCTGFEQDDAGVVAKLQDTRTGERRPEYRADALIACDGLHSAIRKQLHPDEGRPLYSGVNMWRGVSTWKPILTGATMIRAGWLTTGKMVVYPVSNEPDGRQLVNWVAEVETPRHRRRDWNRAGSLDDFISHFEQWHFDWLDVPALIRAADAILEFPMVDQDPLPFWTQGRVTLLGDAAHPMYPRGSNGAGQAIIDARVLSDSLAATRSVPAALQAYEAKRLSATSAVVQMNRTNPPDAILREVFERTGDKPFVSIDDVISRDELLAISDRYRRATGSAAPVHKS